MEKHCQSLSCAFKISTSPLINLFPPHPLSGIQTRLNHLTDDSSSASPQRLLQLQEFQFRALTHALSFPRVKRVVYSTCSVHAEENEIVVVKALEKSRAEAWGFELKEALPKDVWKTRGNGGGKGHGMEALSTASVAENGLESSATNDDEAFHLDRCLRASPSTDFTNGFFVALFERNVDGASITHDSVGVDEAANSDHDEGDGEDSDDKLAPLLDMKSRKRQKKKEAKKRKKQKMMQ